MKHLGDIRESQTLDFMFTTADQQLEPATLASGAIAVYKGNSTSQSTVGVTLTVDFDGRTGLNQVRVVTTDDFYEIAHDYNVVLTSGTVDGISVANRVLASFSIGNRVADATIGNGDIAVDHNTGGTDILRALEADGVTGVDDMLVTAYLAADYAAGSFTPRAQVRTGSDGRWIAPMMLDAGVYKLVYSKPGRQTVVGEVTVA